MIGHNAVEFLYSEDLENTREMMRQSRRGQVTRHFDCRYVHKSGKTITLTWTGTWSEKAQLHYFIGRDITEVRSLEEIEKNLEIISARVRDWIKPSLRLADYCWIMELKLAIDSLWGCWVLLTGPSNFHTFGDSFALAAHIEDNETIWGVTAGIAALLILLGGAMAWVQTQPRWATVCRTLGLLVVGSFWFCLGVSTMAGNTDTLFGVKGVTGGALAYFIALRLLLLI
jgi:hypothetical protein